MNRMVMIFERLSQWYSQPNMHTLALVNVGFIVTLYRLQT